ncbi:MAG: transcription termination/antitermination protein NusA [Anaerolineales bacterium]|nr:transcription termination/antitermination protein NusA [Anaerolineales bacterium]
MKNEFVLAFNEVLEEKQLPKEVVLEALQAAMISAYRRAVNASNAQHVDAVIDPETGRVHIFAEKEVVETVEDSRTEVALTDAQKVDPEAQIGGMVIVDTTPRNFGRVAAQTARQVIQQRIREAERDSQFKHFSNQVGEIISGVIQAVNNQGITLGLEMKAEGLMPRNHQIPGEKFRVHERIRALLLEVKISPRGPQIILSRAHRNFLRRLLENEVPEIYHGMVEIRSIAREPGQRSKVAVAALQPGVDPVGACVGLRGVRIQAIVRELNDEKIDVIEWMADPAVYIAKALSPARVSGVYLNDQSKGAKTATVVVPEDQLSLAIGRDGQNARLAAKLTAWRIDIKSLPEAATDALGKLQNDPDYALMAVNEADIVPQVEAILAKKAEGRPVTPEEYHTLSQFVDRVERGLIRQRQSEQRAEEELELITRARVPAAAFEIPLEKFDVSDRVYAVISEAGFQTVGDLMLQMRLDPDSILGLNGMGPKAMRELQEAIDLAFPPEPEEEEAVAEQPEEILEAAPAAEEAAVPAVSEAEPTAELQPELAAAEVQPEAELAPVEAVEAPIEAPATEAEVIAAPEQPIIEEAAQPTEEEPTSLDEIFALRPEVLEITQTEDEEEEDESDKKKKKKKKKYVEVVYDPDRDVVIAKKKRKRGDGDWEQEW